MGSKTRIVVLHMKEIIYTAIFAALGILLVLLLVLMFQPKRHSRTSSETYTPGVYTSTLTLDNQNLEVEVCVNASSIQSIRFSNLDETVTTMFPLLQPAMEEIADQICESQSLDAISLPESSPYTSKLILDAIKEAVQKAAVP